MKTHCLLTLLIMLILASSTRAQVPPTMAYQGYVTDAEGNPVDGTVNLNLRLYEAAAGGTAMWSENQIGVVVHDGVFAVKLGRIAPLDAVAFDRPLWLGMRVNGGAELVPRVALEAAPYALSVRGFRFVPSEDEDDAPSILGGAASNTVVEGIDGATISGGMDNRAGGGATIGGGRDNQALDCYDTIAGGRDNRAEGGASGGKSSGFRCGATVGGGSDNTANNESTTVAGGWRNTASGSAATVGGGANNVAGGNHATVPGGRENQARGRFSFAAGFYARAVHDGSFVWSDESGSSRDSLVTTGENQFLIRATGGVGIGTDAPKGAMHVSNREEAVDLVLGGTEDSLFGDDGILTSDPDLPSSDLWLVSNNSAALVLDANDDEENSAFFIFDEGLDVLFQVDQDGATRTKRVEVEDDLEAGTAPEEGGVYRDNVVYAWAHVNFDGSVASSFGCTVSKRGTGLYRVTFNRELANGASAIVTPATVNDPIIASAVASRTHADVSTKTFNGAFVSLDAPFYIQVVGRP